MPWPSLMSLPSMVAPLLVPARVTTRMPPPSAPSPPAPLAARQLRLVRCPVRLEIMDRISPSRSCWLPPGLRPRAFAPCSRFLPPFCPTPPRASPHHRQRRPQQRTSEKKGTLGIPLAAVSSGSLQGASGRVLLVPFF
ncbi:hypothetical protein Taro_052566, partial [Colocasia esculenta]|nr:hypothetical protein [Colocasia esculenta]